MYELATSVSFLLLLIWLICVFSSKTNSTIKTLMAITGVLVFIVALIAIFLAYLKSPNYQNIGKYKPILNNGNLHYFTIRGHVDKKLNGLIKPEWQAVYNSSTKKCDVVYNRVEGVSGSRELKTMYKPSVSPQGNYNVRIPINKYKKGFCKWQLVSIDSNYGTESSMNSFVRFYQPGNCISCSLRSVKNNVAIPSQIKFTNYCKFNRFKSLDCIAKGEVLQKLFNDDLLTTRDYTVIADYRFQEGR